MQIDKIKITDGRHFHKTSRRNFYKMNYTNSFFTRSKITFRHDLRRDFLRAQVQRNGCWKNSCEKMKTKKNYLLDAK